LYTVVADSIKPELPVAKVARSTGFEFCVYCLLRIIS